MNRILSLIVVLLVTLAGRTTLCVSAQSTLPFVPTTVVNGQFSDDTHWYTIYVRDAKYLYIDTATQEVRCAVGNKPDGRDDRFLWTFSGNDQQGYRLYNRQAGVKNFLGATQIENHVYPTLTGATPFNTFQFAPNGDGFSLYEPNYKAYLNDLGQTGLMGFWVGGSGATSAGSRMIIEEVDFSGTGTGGGGGTGGGTVDPDTFLGDASQLIINEVQVANIDQYLDPSINYGGWIELYNPTDDVIDLGHLYVRGIDADGVEQLFHLRKDFGTVAPHGFRNIWFDHNAHYGNKDESTYRAYHQVEWKLDYKGGTIALLDRDGTTELTAVTYPTAVPRASYARTSDGGETWGWHATGTPEGSNENQDYLSSPVRLPAPVGDRQGGIFSGSVTVHVSIPSGATLRYTTDGTTPTATSRSSNNGTFTYSSTTTLRLRFFTDGMLPSPVTTYSFIKKDSQYKLPLLSIVTDDANINGWDKGIFDYGNGRPGYGTNADSNRNMEWERPVNIEYFDLAADGSYVTALNQEADMAVCGGWSRISSTPPPFKIKAAEQYEGQNYLLYPIFKDKGYLKHRTLQMRRENDLKDAAVQEIARRSGLYLDTQGWQPAQVILNGKSLGYIPIREPNNKHFGLANYGIDGDDIDVFEIHCDSSYVQSTGTKDAFLLWYDLASRCTDDDVYDELCRLVDVDEYINYMCVELYIGNNDWPWNNVKGFRSRKDGKFHMVLMDIGDRLCSITSAFANLTDNQYPARFQYRELEFVTIFLNMLENARFRRQFIDSYCLVAGSVYNPDYVNDVVSDMVADLREALSTHGTTIISSLQNRAPFMIEDLMNYKPLGLSASQRMTATIGSDTSGAHISLNGLEIPTGHFSGTLFAPVTLKATAPAGYVFEGWRQDYGRDYLSTDETLVLEQGKQDYGTLIAEYRYVGSEVPVRINEVSPANEVYVSDLWKRSDWVELYNTTDHDVDVAGMFLSDKASKPTKYCITAASVEGGATAPALATVIPPHGTLVVWCDNLMGTDQLHATFKLGNDNGSVVTLQAADGSWTDTLHYDRCLGTQSYGRFPDGSDSVYLMERATIDGPNHLTSVIVTPYATTTIATVAQTIARALTPGSRITTSDIENIVRRVLEK